MNTSAQENSGKVSELGLVFTNLNSFGLRYKYGNKKTLFRITSVVLNGANTSKNIDASSINGASTSISGTPSSNIGFGLNIGFEIRKPINENLFLFYGIDLINSFTQSNTNTVSPSTYSYNFTDTNNVQRTLSTLVNNTSSSTSINLSSGLGFVVGMTYKVNTFFSISAELVPTISYTYASANTASTNYNVQWIPDKIGNKTYNYTPTTFTNTTSNQTAITRGINYGIANTGASIILSFRIK